MADGFEYDVAFSFAGEDRHLVEPIADRVSAAGLSVFYDSFEQAELWGKDLYVHLHEIYSKRARYCVMFASSAYAQKMWPSHERQAAQERALREKGAAYILPVRIDGAEIPGLPATIGYLDIEQGVDFICEMLMRKLRGPHPTVSNDVPSGLAPATTVARENREPPFGIVRDVPEPLRMGRGRMPDAIALLSAAAPPSGPRREVVVVPYDLPAGGIRKNEAVERLHAARLRQPLGSHLFPTGPLEETAKRDEKGILWDEKPRPTWHLQFALGFDGSFGQREFISETQRNSPNWGSGIGLFSTLDRVIGAVMLAQRLSPTGLRWLVLKLDEIGEQTARLRLRERSAHGCPSVRWPAVGEVVDRADCFKLR